MMSFLSRRERPFFRGGALVEVVGVGAAGAGLAEVVVFFFFFPATWAQVPWEAADEVLQGTAEDALKEYHAQYQRRPRDHRV